jgi:hypothetical protein
MSKAADMVRDGIEAQKAEIWRAQYAGEVKAVLVKRAESYWQDAKKFRDRAKIHGKPVLSEAEDAYWASVYFAVAEELRKVAASLGEKS